MRTGGKFWALLDNKAESSPFCVRTFSFVPSLLLPVDFSRLSKLMHIIMITINNMWEKARHCAISVLIWFGSPTFLLRISSQKPTVTRDAQWYLSLEIRLYIRNWREWDEVWFWLDVNGGLNHLPIELRRRSGLAAAGIFGKLSSKLLWHQDRACSPLGGGGGEGGGGGQGQGGWGRGGGGRVQQGQRQLGSLASYHRNCFDTRIGRALHYIQNSPHQSYHQNIQRC